MAATLLGMTTAGAEAQSPAPGSAGREGSTLMIRNDGNSGDETFRVARGAFWPTRLFVGTREVTDPDGFTQVEPARAPGAPTWLSRAMDRKDPNFV